jgi:hypothetical protein
MLILRMLTYRNTTVWALLDDDDDDKPVWPIWAVRILSGSKHMPVSVVS